MSNPDRGTCPRTDKARFTHDEAIEKVRRAKLRGHVMSIYRCLECQGWWHTTHAGDDRGGGVQRGKQHRTTRSQQRAKNALRKGRR